MTVFDNCFAIVVGTEGGFQNRHDDSGNWTGGRVGAGILKGTKYGISAAAYPQLDIANLTLEQAKAIYARDYWDRIAGDKLPPPLALIAFDSAVNSGVGEAARWLQQALGVPADGAIGPATLAALAACKDGARLCAEVLARRIVADADLPNWKINALGWSRRIAALPFQSLTVGAAA